MNDLPPTEVEIKPLAVWLTREEMLVTYAYQLVAHIYPCLGAEQMSESEREATFVSLGEALRWAIRELIRQGFIYTAINMRPDGELYLTANEVICPENIILLGKLRRGKLISPIAAISTALVEFEKRGLSIERSQMVDVLLQCQSDAKRARQMVEEDPDLVAAMDKVFDAALASVGIVSLGRKPMVN